MAESIAIKWWKEKGAKELNAFASEYAGEGIGKIPLPNISGFKIPPEVTIDASLINLMRKDGADVGVDRQEGCLYIKIY